MPAIILQGNSLSERHHNLNAAVNEAFKNKLPINDASSPGEATDVDNIFKIDLATKYRNVDYIIENLKSTDSLRVARALKASWLITDTKYSHIINPTYIDTVLSPLISGKTLNKLLYKITYHLNDTKRCEEFYIFYRKRHDEHNMKKFLPNCSIAFIKEQIVMKDFDITPEYLSLLSFKSWEIVATYVDMQVDKKISSEFLFELKNLLNVNGDFYLDLVENCIQVSKYSYNNFYLGQRVTREIVRNHKSRIFAKPHFYLKLLHFNHLTRALTKDDIRNLATLITSYNNFWSNDLLKSLLNKLPIENRYHFITSVYEKYHPNEPFEMDSEFTKNRWYNYMSVKQKEEWALEHVARMDEHLGHVFQWYQFISFKITFVELKKLLKAETDAYYREKMFVILVSTCTDEESDVFDLLKYFHDRHINEIMSFKINIIQRIIQSKKVYRHGEEVWKILNEILLNMRIYESVNDCSRDFKEKAVAQILAYHLINDKSIGEKVLKLFDDHYTRLNMMVNTEWNEKVFNFLYKWNLQKIEGQDMKISECLEYVKRKTNELIGVTECYGYQPKPDIFSLIRRIREHDPKFIPSSCTRELLKEFMVPKEPVLPELDEDVGMRLLKKDIKLLDAYKSQFDDDIKNNLMTYRKFLTNIRIYFGNDFAQEWRKYFLSKFEGNRKDPKGCACVLFGLSILLPAGEYEQFIKEYQPEKARLVWSEADPCLVHIQNNIGKFMYLVRPTVNTDYLMSFAKGDFLQHTIQSLSSINRQLPLEECRKFVMKLLAGRISVRKHGIRMAFTKYTKLELLEMFRGMWANTSNVSIQKLLCENIHRLLTEADNDEIRLEVWKLLKVILGQLHGNEHLINIITMRDSEKIGVSVKPQYCIEYWYLLQTAPNIYQTWSYKSANVREMAHHDLINLFDEQFLKGIITDFLHDQFAKTTTEKKETPSYYINAVWSLISQFLVICKTRDIAERRKDILKITVRYIFDNWTVKETQKTLQDILKQLLKNSQSVLHINKEDVFNPIYIFEFIYSEMNKLLPKQDYYEHHLWLRLAMIFIDSLFESRASKPDSFEAQSRLWAEIFGSHIKEFMKVEIVDNYPSLPQLFRHYFFKFLDTELTGHYSHNKEKFYNGICKGLLSEEAEIYSNNLAIECLVKVKLSRDISDADKQEADFLMDTLRTINIPYFNYFIDSRIKPYSPVFC